MYVGKVKGKDAAGRNKLWFARDRAEGVMQYFKNLEGPDGAKAFAEDYNSDKRRRSHNMAPSNKALRKITARQLIRSYAHFGGNLIAEDDELYDNKDELIESCELQINLALVLLNFSNLKICEKSLFDFTPQVAEKYVEDMLNETYISNGSDVEKKYSPDTIRRNISVIQRAWKWGRKTITVPNLSNLENPWKGIRVFGAGAKRQRGLRKGELEKLIKHCERLRGSNRFYVSLAIELAVDTAMRRQEIFDLTWQDIDFENRRINIKHDKNSWRRLQKGLPENRLIFLPPMSQLMLMQLFISLHEFGCTPGKENFKIPKDFRPPNGKIFMGFEKTPMTGEGFEQAFKQVRDWAGIRDTNPRKQLTPHSLRAAAEMAFRRVDLSDKLIDVQKNGIKSHYDVEEDLLEIVQNKLDKAYFGKPLLSIAEIEKERAEHQREFESFCREGVKEGLTREEAIELATAMMFERYPAYAQLKAWADSILAKRALLAEEVE